MNNRPFTEEYEHDRGIWDSCAAVYEKKIVGGHPDVIAYELFEEDLIERVLRYLIRDCGKSVNMFDFGCGSGRLHQRFGIKMKKIEDSSSQDFHSLRQVREKRPEYSYCPDFDKGISKIGGVDFSAEMITLAKKKVSESGLGTELGKRINFSVGSAFTVDPYTGPALPVAVSVCNSIGVMQGPEGAGQLFESVRRYVEPQKGIGIISAYCKEALPTYGLGNYESTLDVSGQPSWLTPDTYAGEEFIQIPRRYKYHHDTDTKTIVDVFDKSGKCVKSGHVLKRDPELTQKTLEEGIVSTYQGYTSHWYPWSQMDKWMRDKWGSLHSRHIEGENIDSLRGTPAQICVLDYSGALTELFKSFGLSDRLSRF